MISFRTIKPQPFNEAAAKAAIVKQAESVGKLMVKDFDRVTTGWTGDRPAWRSVVENGPGAIVIRVQLADPGSAGAEKWLYLDLGTSPHRIEPKKPGGTLAFPSQHQAGSAPGSLRTVQGKSSGDTVFAKGVSHPGIKARGWSKILKAQWERDVKTFMQAGFREAANASGHSMEGSGAK